MINNKGQAFSVFNLLIAAVVSLAILGLLMSIMGGLDVFGTTKSPDEAATTLLQNAINSPYTEKTDEVTFKDNIKIRASALEAATDITKEQIGFCKSSQVPDFFEIEENKLSYTRTTKYTARLLAYCIDEGENITDDLTEYDLTCNGPKNSNPACIIAVIPK